MSVFAPTPPEGADIHECEDCHGTGIIDEGTLNERECQACDGTGEWFE